MHPLITFSLCFILSQSAVQKKYLLVAGDITCKACVIELHTYLEKKTKKAGLEIALQDKGHFILNESSLSYFQKELPSSKIVFLSNALLFPKKEKYPYLLKINKGDTIKVSYDSLFVDDVLNVRHLN